MEMASIVNTMASYGGQAIWSIATLSATLLAISILWALYNISPFHPLAKYPGPLLWRATRLFASYHHATGDLYQHIGRIHEKYGKTVRIAPDELSFTSPGAWPDIFNTRPQLPKSKFHYGGSEESMLRTPDDLEHMRLRRLAGPAFLKAGINELEPVLLKHADELCRELKAASEEGSQDLGQWFMWTTADVIGKLSLDLDFHCLKNRRTHEWQQFLLGSLKLTAIVNQFRRFGFPTVLLLPFMPRDILTKRKMFYKTANESISERLAAEKEYDENDPNRKRDIVGLMLREMKDGSQLTESEITANSILFIGAGAESTATCLSATMYHLLKAPRVMKKLQQEIRSTFAKSDEITLKAVNESVYLRAVIEESLRIFGVASYFGPRVTQKGGNVIDGEVVPANTTVTTAVWHIGQSERFWDDPKEFRPERWVNNEVQTVSGLAPDEIMKPFSVGPRNCIGKPLALAEARLITAKLLWHFDVELDKGQDTWVEDAKFYILWELKPLKVRLTPVQ